PASCAVFQAAAGGDGRTRGAKRGSAKSRGSSPGGGRGKGAAVSRGVEEGARAGLRRARSGAQETAGGERCAAEKDAHNRWQRRRGCKGAARKGVGGRKTGCRRQRGPAGGGNRPGGMEKPATARWSGERGSMKGLRAGSVFAVLAVVLLVFATGTYG